MNYIWNGCGCSPKFGICKYCPATYFCKSRYLLQTLQYYSNDVSASKIRSNPNISADPFLLTKANRLSLHRDIKKLLSSKLTKLQASSRYYFDGHGKSFRPITTMLISQACNMHKYSNSTLTNSQYQLAMISEMIHVSSLFHDDVIDEAMTRRNKPSVNVQFSPNEAIVAGDFILSNATILLAQLRNTEVVTCFSKIIDNLVRGELMQLLSADDINERFNQYLLKTYRKTGSLIAYSCQMAALLSDVPECLQNSAFEYGKSLGLSFQLVDDALDFIVTSEDMGKQTNADLSSGLATAPVLFAAQKFPDMHALISRRFREKGDVQQAMEYLQKSNGIEETFMLAQKYADNAISHLEPLKDSLHKEALINLAKFVVSRRR